MNKDKEEMNEVKMMEEDDNSTSNSSSSSSSKSSPKKSNVLSPALPGDEQRTKEALNRIIHDDKYKLVFTVYGGEYLMITNQTKKLSTLDKLHLVEFDFYYNKETGRLFGTKAMFDLHFKAHTMITEKILESGKAFFIDKDYYGKKRVSEKAKQLNKELKDAGLKCTHGAKYFDVAHLEHFFSIIDPNDRFQVKFNTLMNLLKPFIDITKIKQRPIEDRKQHGFDSDEESKIVQDGPIIKKGKRTLDEVFEEGQEYYRKANECFKTYKKLKEKEEKKVKNN